jgi:hypothetical protein
MEVNFNENTDVQCMTHKKCRTYALFALHKSRSTEDL